jgi:hypothetical protein
MNSIFKGREKQGTVLIISGNNFFNKRFSAFFPLSRKFTGILADLHLANENCSS